MGLFNHLCICQFFIGGHSVFSWCRRFPAPESMSEKKWCLEAESQRRKSTWRIIPGDVSDWWPFVDCKSPISRVNLLPKWLKWVIDRVDPNYLYTGMILQVPPKTKSEPTPWKRGRLPSLKLTRHSTSKRMVGRLLSHCLVSGAILGLGTVSKKESRSSLPNHHGFQG